MKLEKLTFHYVYPNIDKKELQLPNQMCWLIVDLWGIKL